VSAVGIGFGARLLKPVPLAVPSSVPVPGSIVGSTVGVGVGSSDVVELVVSVL